ncbi:MAG: hypothetical protein MJZ11_07835 [Lachnospiraceae bacterium]|nr:hypothetical protein [Lachnospiraceae bacterium]
MSSGMDVVNRHATMLIIVKNAKATVTIRCIRRSCWKNDIWIRRSLRKSSLSEKSETLYFSTYSVTYFM